MVGRIAGSDLQIMIFGAVLCKAGETGEVGITDQHDVYAWYRRNFKRVVHCLHGFNHDYHQHVVIDGMTESGSFRDNWRPHPWTLTAGFCHSLIP